MAAGKDQNVVAAYKDVSCTACAMHVAACSSQQSHQV